MTNNERRQSILEALTAATAPLNATKLAEMHNVTRQIIVADIALLRAAGNNIRAEHRGYVLNKNEGTNKRKIVCQHNNENMAEELYAIVDMGGEVIDVQVEHSIYGVISADLAISSRYDVDQFIKAINESGSVPLSDLTGGVHVHTISAKNDEVFERICKKLSELGILIQD